MLGCVATKMTGVKSLIGSKPRFVERRVGAKDGVVASHERVAVRGRFRRDFRYDVAAGARAIIENDGLTEALRELLPQQPRQYVGGTARRFGAIKRRGLVGYS